MPSNTDLPVKFAQTVINELATIHAHSETMSYFMIRDMATRNNIDFDSLQAQYDAYLVKKTKHFSSHYEKLLGLSTPQDGQK